MFRNMMTNKNLMDQLKSSIKSQSNPNMQKVEDKIIGKAPIKSKSRINKP